MADAAIMKQIEQAEQTEQTEHIVRALQAGSKKLHWRSALSRVLRLRRSGGLVNNDILAALQITLHPPSSTSTLSPKMLKRVKSYAASKEKMRWWNKLYPVGEKEEDRGFLIGLQYCERLITQYRNQTKGLMNNGRWVYQSVFENFYIICRAAYANRCIVNNEGRTTYFTVPQLNVNVEKPTTHTSKHLSLFNMA